MNYNHITTKKAVYILEKHPNTSIKAFEVIIKIAKKHPELKNEINFLTQEHYTSTLSPGIKNSFNRILKDL